MDIEVLNLQANADSIDKATASINNLATAIDKIDKKTSEITKSTFDLAKSLDGATKSAAKTKESIENVGEATKPLKGVERVIDNLQNTLKVLRQQTIDASDGFAQLGDGFTRSQARALANARALGATADQLKSIAQLQQQMNALNSNPFDMSVGALAYISKIRSELEKTIPLTEKYGDLTKTQLQQMARGYAEIEQRIAATNGSMEDLARESEEYTKKYLEQARSVNVMTTAIENREKASKALLGQEVEMARNGDKMKEMFVRNEHEKLKADEERTKKQLANLTQYNQEISKQFDTLKAKFETTQKERAKTYEREVAANGDAMKNTYLEYRKTIAAASDDVARQMAANSDTMKTAFIENEKKKAEASMQYAKAMAANSDTMKAAFIQNQKEIQEQAKKSAKEIADLTAYNAGIDAQMDKAKAAFIKNEKEKLTAVEKTAKQAADADAKYQRDLAANMDSAKAAWVRNENAKAAAIQGANKAAQEQVERLAFINMQIQAGFGQANANAIYKYKQLLEQSGMSANDAAVAMERFQASLMQNQNLRAAINPINKVKDSITQLDSATRHAARGISMQLGDIGISLASGMNPLTVFIQQGDQIRILLEQIADKSVNTSELLRDTVKSMAMSIVQVGQLIGSFLFEAVRASGEAIGKLTISLIDAAGNMVGLGNAGTNTAKRLVESAEAGNKFSIALLGLFKTIQALAGVALIATVSALGMLITAMIQADSHQTKLAKSIGQYGASLGIAANEARAMALASDESTSSVVNAIGAVAKAGGFTQEQLKIVTDSAVEMNRVFGVSIEDVVSQYKSLREDPVKALIELQARTGDVNNEIISKIRIMKEEGNQYQAIDLAMEEYAAANKRTTDQTVQNLGVVATLLDKMANAWRSLYKEIEQAAMGESTIQKLAAAGLRLREAEANRGKTDWFFNDYEEQYRVALQSYNLLMQRYVQENQVAAEKKKQADAAALEAKYLDDINNAKPAQIKFAEKQLQLQNDYNQALKNGASPEFLAGLSGLMQKNADEYLKSLETTSSATTKKTDDIQKYFNRLLEGASDLALNTRQELLRLQGGYEQMTDSQKKWFDAQNDPNWNKLTERQKQEYENALKFVAQNEQKIANLKTELEIKKQIAEFNETLRGLDEEIADENAELELRNNLLWATEDQAKAIQDEYNKNVSIIALENKYLVIRNKLYAQANTLIGQNPEAREQVLQQLERDLNDLNTRYGLQLNQVYSNAAIKGQEEYVAKFKEIQGTVTDIISTALFEGGKEGSKKLKDVLKAEFRNYVIKVFIEPVVGQVMGSIFGTSGGSFGGGSTGGSTGGVFGLPGGGDIGANVANFLDEAAIRSLSNGYTALGEGLGTLGSYVNSANTYLKSIPGFEGGVSSAFGYANSVGTAMDGKYSKALGQAIGTYFGGPIGAAIGGAIGDAIGWEKKPSDKTSWAVIDPTTGRLGEVGDMGGKKAAPQEQKDANVLLSQVVGGFANLAGITGELVTAMGSRDGIRVAITGGFKTPEGAAGGGAWLGGKETIYSFGSDLETAVVRMFDDLVDEGNLDQALIDTWRRMGDEIDGTTRSSGELVSVLNLLTSGYEEMDIERANLLQTEGETLEQAYLRMLNVEKALKGVISTENEFTNSAKALAMEFERLGLAIPTSAETLGSVVSGLDLSSSNGQALYKTLMQLAPAFLQVEAAFESNYNLLLSEQELLNKNTKDLSKTFAAIGVAMPKSNQEFRNLIDAVNTTTSSGVELKAQLLSLVPAFVELQSASQNAGDSLESAFSILNTIADQQIAILRESFVETDRALAALERSINREKQLLQDRINTATETERVMTDMFNSLKEGVKSLRGEVTSTMSMQTTQARSVISGALATGMLPSPETLSGAVSSLTTGLSSNVYVSKAERDKAFIMLSNDLEDLQEIAEPQLTEAEQTVVALKAQIEILDSQLEEAKTTVDAIRGVDVSVESVDRSIRNLQTAMRAEEQSRAQIAKIEEQINFARLQYEELTNVNNNIKSLEQALANFNTAAQAKAQAAAQAAPAATAASAASASAYEPYSVNDTPALRQKKVEAQTGVKVSANDSALVAAAKVLYQSINGGANMVEYNKAAAAVGGNIGAAVGWDGSREGAEKLRKIYGFASGGYHTGGLRLVGENGPELEVTGPSRIYSAEQTRDLMGGNSAAVAEAIETLNENISMLRAEVRAVATNTSKSAKLLDRAMPDGQSILVTTTA